MKQFQVLNNILNYNIYLTLLKKDLCKQAAKVQRIKAEKQLAEVIRIEKVKKNGDHRLTILIYFH